MSTEITIKVEFSGGMELLFENKRQHDIAINKLNHVGEPCTLKDLILHIRDNMMTDKKDLFVDNDTVRPGILVLINGADWELCDELEYKLEDNDEVVFISTLHGG